MTSEFAKSYLEKWRNSPVVNSPQVPFLNITLSEHSIGLLKAWKAEREIEAVEKQKASVSKDDPFYGTYQMMWECGQPYHGAIGGAVTYEIGVTSMGYTIVAKYHDSDNTINLTEYDLW